MSHRYSHAIKSLHGASEREGAVLSIIRKIGPTLALWRQRREFREELRRLLRVAPHMIADIGLSRSSARAESEKLFWLP